MPAAKPRHAPPLNQGSDILALTIRNPHYRDHNIMLKLAALDEGDTVDYEIALIFCGIIADNSWSTGWFARSANGDNICERGLPIAAADGDVFYFVKEKNYKYPIYISWAHWRLPKADADLPPAFAALPIDSPPSILQGGGYLGDVKERDQSCRVSGIIDCTEVACLVPASEKEWWESNMSVRGELSILTAKNGLLLRVDMQNSFDSGAWIPMATDEGRLILYVVRPTCLSYQFVELWHAAEMQSLAGIDRRCLFARVAWVVLSLQHEFLDLRCLASESLSVRMSNGEKEELTPQDFQQFHPAQPDYVPKSTCFTDSIRRSFGHQRTDPKLPEGYDWKSRTLKYSPRKFSSGLNDSNIKGVFCHRGLYERARNIPENSILAIEYGIQKGLLLHEVDVRTSSSDGRMFIAHDQVARRVTSKDRNWSSIVIHETDLVARRVGKNRFATSHMRTGEKVAYVEDLLNDAIIPHSHDCCFQLDLRGRAFPKAIIRFGKDLENCRKVLLKGNNSDFPTVDALEKALCVESRQETWHWWDIDISLRIILVFYNKPFIDQALHEKGIDPSLASPDDRSNLEYQHLYSIVMKQVSSFIKMRDLRLVPLSGYDFIHEIAHSGLGLGYDIETGHAFNPLCWRVDTKVIDLTHNGDCRLA